MLGAAVPGWFMVAFDSTLIGALFFVLLATLLLLMGLMVPIVFFNAPKRAVPPRFRSDKGALEVWWHKLRETLGGR